MKRSWMVAILLFAACSKHEEEKEHEVTASDQACLSDQQVKDAQLTIAPAGDQDVGGAIVASGKVTFDDLRVSHVFSPVTGRVTQILAQPGERVKKGAPLAVINSPDVGSAFSDLAKAQADLVAAEHDFKRKQDLFNAHAGSQSDLEAAEDSYGKAKAELERAEQKARLFRTGNFDKVTQEYTLRALIDGEVIARNVNPGTEVQGQYSGGTAVELFTIGELDSVWVLADVFEMDVASVKKGARVTVKVVAYPDRVFEGRVDWVSDTLDPNSRTAKVRCAIKNPMLVANDPSSRPLKPEMYATVSVSVAERRALAIPRSALLRLGDQTVVFVEAPPAPGAPPNTRCFERHPIAVDEDEGGDFLPVTHGLARGDKVVTSGGILLSGMM